MTMIVAAHFDKKKQADGAVKAQIGIGIAADVLGIFGGCRAARSRS